MGHDALKSSSLWTQFLEIGVSTLSQRKNETSHHFYVPGNPVYDTPHWSGVEESHRGVKETCDQGIVKFLTGVHQASPEEIVVD